MKKFIISTILILAFGAYAIHQKYGGKDDVNVIPPVGLSSNQSPPSNSDSNSSSTGNTSGGSESTNPATKPTPAPSPTPAPVPKPIGQYKDGIYTSPTEDAFYGPVQIKVTTSGGKITAVDWLQYPTDRSTSREISRQATPWLTQEAIQVQSAKVNIISGATQTSLGFIKALQSVVSQAKA